MARLATSSGRDGDAPLMLEELVPPELPPDLAVARLVGLAKSLLLERSQLLEEIQSHAVLEQACGIVAERFALDVRLASGVLARAALAAEVSIHDLAAAVVDGRRTPPELAAAIGAVDGGAEAA